MSSRSRHTRCALVTGVQTCALPICSVSGTNFKPYAKLLSALGIPFAVITDYDPVTGKPPLSYNRALKLVRTIDEAREGGDTAGLLSEIDSLESYQESFDRCEDFGIFVNDSTLETELLDCGFGTELFATLRDGGLSSERKARVAEWEEDESQVDRAELIRMIEAMGKGRFAQRLAGRVADKTVPAYISRAIDHVVGLV